MSDRIIATSTAINGEIIEYKLSDELVRRKNSNYISARRGEYQQYHFDIYISNGSQFRINRNNKE